MITLVAATIFAVGTYFYLECWGVESKAASVLGAFCIPWMSRIPMFFFEMLVKIRPIESRPSFETLHVYDVVSVASSLAWVVWVYFLGRGEKQKGRWGFAVALLPYLAGLAYAAWIHRENVEIRDSRLLEAYRFSAGREGVFLAPNYFSGEDALVVMPSEDFEDWIRTGVAPKDFKAFVTACAPRFVPLPLGNTTLCFISGLDSEVCFELSVAKGDVVRLGDRNPGYSACDEEDSRCRVLDRGPIANREQFEYISEDQERWASFLPGGLVLVNDIVSRDRFFVRLVTLKYRMDQKEYSSLAKSLAEVAQESSENEFYEARESLSYLKEMTEDSWGDARKTSLLCKDTVCSPTFQELRSRALGIIGHAREIASCRFSRP